MLFEVTARYLNFDMFLKPFGRRRSARDYSGTESRYLDRQYPFYDTLSQSHSRHSICTITFPEYQSVFNVLRLACSLLFTHSQTSLRLSQIYCGLLMYNSYLFPVLRFTS